MGRPSKNTQMDKNKEKIVVSESPTKTFIFLPLCLFFLPCVQNVCMYCYCSNPDFLVKV